MIDFWFCSYNFDGLFFIHNSCDTLITGHSIVGFAMYYFTYDPWIGKLLYLEDFFVMSDYRGMTEFRGAALKRNQGLKSLKWPFKWYFSFFFRLWHRIRNSEESKPGMSWCFQICKGYWIILTPESKLGLGKQVKCHWVCVFLSCITGCDEVSLQQHALLGSRVEWTIYQLLQKKRCFWSVQRRGMETLQDRQGVLAKNGSRGVRSAGVDNDSFHSILE